MGGLSLISLPSAPTSVSTSGLNVRSPAIANAVTSSGDVTNACVAGLPSLRAAKLRLYDVMMLFASPAGWGVSQRAQLQEQIQAQAPQPL